jgi:hypothetical protein
MQDFCLTLSKVLSKSTQATFLRGLISFYNPAMDAPAFPITPVADDNLDITTFPKHL